MLSEPARVDYPIPDAIDPNDKFMVCRRNDQTERVVQSESTPDRAQHSVEVLNEHEINNNRKPVFYWRLRKPGETDDKVRRNWKHWKDFCGIGNKGTIGAGCGEADL